MMQVPSRANSRNPGDVVQDDLASFCVIYLEILVAPVAQDQLDDLAVTHTEPATLMIGDGAAALY
jgi:hypothetical protein